MYERATTSTANAKTPVPTRTKNTSSVITSSVRAMTMRPARRYSYTLLSREVAFGLTCNQGDYKGCKCLGDSVLISDNNPNFDKAVKYMKEFTDVYENIDKYVTKPDTKCSSSSYSDAIAVDKSKAYELGEKFCSGLDQSKESTKDLEFNDFVFSFKYKPGDKCYTNCKDTIHKMVCKYSIGPFKAILKNRT